MKGSAWVTAGYGSAQVIRFASNLILARLLFPRAFGLMLLVNVFLQGLQLFSDLGIGASIVQNERSDRAFLDTAWTLQIARGLVLWLATFAVAWPASVLYGERQLLWMLPVAGLATCLDGFVSTAVSTANRDLRLARVQVLEFLVQVAASAVTIVAAWATRSVWALVVGMVAGSAARTLMSHVFLPGHRNRLCWEKEAAASLFHFGKWVFVSSVVTFLAQQGDRLVFGKMLPLERLGVYNIALSLCEAPATLISTISFRIFFPLFSEMRRSSPDVDAAYRRASAAVALLGGAAALGLTVAGPLLIRILYDTRYAEAGWILRLLSLAIWSTSLVHFTASVVLANGQVKWLAIANAVRLIWLIGAVPLAFARWGFEAAVIAVAVADVPRYIVLGFACRSAGLHIFWTDLLRTATFAAAAGVGLLALQAMGPNSIYTVTLACTASFVIWFAGNLDASRWYLGKARGALAARLQ